MGDTAAAGGVFIGLGLRGVREIAAATTAGTADAGVPGIGPIKYTYTDYLFRTGWLIRICGIIGCM